MKKKGIFIYDGPLNKLEDNQYYGISLNNEMFERYADLVDELKIAIRVREIKEEEKNKFSLINLPFIEEVIKLPTFHISNIRKARKIIMNALQDVDIAIIRLPSFYGSLACYILNKMNKPYLVEVVGCAWDALWNHSMTGKVIAPFFYLMNKHSIRKAPNLIYITEEFLQNRYPTNGEWISCSNVDLKDKNNSISYRSKNKEDLIILATVGKVDVQYKGQKYVIKALKKLKEKGYNLKYQLVGSGNPSKLLKLAKKLEVEDSIEILGPKPHQEIFKWLDKVDIYVQPSLAEAQGRSLIEAMSRGCACICSNVGGMVELVDKKYIFQKRKIDQIVCTIEKAIHDMTDLSQQSYETSKKFSKELIRNKRKEYFIKIKESL